MLCGIEVNLVLLIILLVILGEFYYQVEVMVCKCHVTSGRVF